MLKNVVFLDRDGTINQDVAGYIKSGSEFKFLLRSTESLSEFNAAVFAAIVITNQSAISRRLISLRELENIHSKMKAAVESNGGEISGIFFCPHLPEDGCDCRKPAPGLVYRAQKKHDIDLSTAVMIGDSARDIECGRKAGCARSILVQTGNGRDARRILAEKDLHPDLYAAAQWLIGSRS